MTRGVPLMTRCCTKRCFWPKKPETRKTKSIIHPKSAKFTKDLDADFAVFTLDLHQEISYNAAVVYGVGRK